MQSVRSSLLMLCCIVLSLAAVAVEQPLDGTFRPVASSPETVWFYQNTPVKVAKTEYRGFGFLKDTKGGQADGWVEFDVRGWDRFTAQVGLSDAWPKWQESGDVTFFVDNEPAGTCRCKRGEPAIPVNILLTGKSRLKIDMHIFVLLATPLLAQGNLPLSPGTYPGEIRSNPKDGAPMVWVPAGEFTMGGISPEKDPKLNAMPSRQVYLDGYWIYQYEVSVAQYRRFCQLTGRNMPVKPHWQLQETHPIVRVNWHDATDYAVWAGASLPTEAQWEKAARGTDGRLYPWGNAWDPKKCNAWDAGKVDGYLYTAPVWSYPWGASPYGALNMAGNVWEWCADWYDQLYLPTANNPTGPATGDNKVQRGGSGGDENISRTKVTARVGSHPGAGGLDGFRCVVKVPVP